MTPPGKLSRLHLIVAGAMVLAGAMVVAGGLCAIGVFIVRERAAAQRAAAIGRLAQLALALSNYEFAHGTLPPLYVRDDAGTPIQSWRSLLLSELEWPDGFERPDLSEPWNSAKNRRIYQAAPQGQWCYFSRGNPPSRPPSACLLALLSPNSIWNPETGIPKGTLDQNPGAILLVSVPESNIDPLEPRDVTEEEVRALIENGAAAYFITADRTYGDVRIKNGSLTFSPDVTR